MWANSFEMNACKWEKDILDDSKALLTLLIPIVKSVLGLVIPVAVVTVTIIIMKWSIRSFCECRKGKED